jgi:hypothetical protein
MKAISKRLCELENRLGIGTRTEQKLWVVTIAGRQLALDEDACVGILRDCGFLPTHRFGVVDLSKIPDGLNAKEMERFLREKGARDLRSEQGPSAAASQENQRR